MALEPSVTYISDLNPLWPLGADPASISDDNHRNIKKALLNDFPGFAGSILVTGVDGGVVNAYTLTPATPLPSYNAKTIYILSPSITNTGPATYNVSGLGNRAVNSVIGAPLDAGELAAGSKYLACDTGVAMQLLAITKNYVDQLAFGSALPAQPGGSISYNLTSANGAASWQIPKISRSGRTANTILGLADSHSWIDITAGTFAQTIGAAATLGAGWCAWVGNSGTGDITFTPTGADTIDGAATRIMYQGEVIFVESDGISNFNIYVVKPFSKVFTASGTFMRPTGYQYFEGEVVSAGASGQRTNNTATASVGGCAGGAFPFVFSAAQIGASQAITIGNGGAAVVGVSSGNAGQDSSIGTLLIVQGATFSGAGAVATSASTVYLKGATSGNAIGFESPNANAGTGPSAIWGGGAASNSTVAGAGGCSIYGGGSGAGVDASGNIRLPGTSIFAGNGGVASIAGNGGDGVAPGGGGGATQTGTRSGAGGRGEVRIRGK